MLRYKARLKQAGVRFCLCLFVWQIQRFPATYVGLLDIQNLFVVDLQHIFSEASLPFSLVEEVVEVAAEGDEHEAESEETKYTWQEKKNKENT